MAGAAQPELSRPVALERLGAAPYETRLVASEAERAALARRFGLLDLARLEARLSLRRTGPTGPGARLRLSGRLEAEVVQACVVSLEPVASTLAEDFEQVYRLDAPAGAGAEVTVGPGPEDEDPEPLGAGGLDLGEAVAQQLGLALDPYPRAPGTRVPERYRPGDGAPGDEAPGAPGAPGRHRPFEALRGLKPRRRD